MSSTAKTTDTYTTLAARAEAAATGCLSVGAGAAEVSLYLVDGHLIASRASDDTTVLVDRLEAAGALTSDRAKQLRRMQEMSMPVSGAHSQDPIIGLLLEEADDDALEAVLDTRFEENVAFFVGHRSAPRWDDGVVPWVFSIRMGHDTIELIESASNLADLAASVGERDLLRRDGARPAEGLLRAIFDATGDGERRASDLVQELGVPPVMARALIARSIAEGSLARVDHSPPAAEIVDDSMVDDEEMAAFSGVDDVHRGGPSAGAFVTERHHLDRVEIFDDVAPTGRESTYSAPTLTEEDAMEKIDVANGVLTRLVKAFDAHGEGARYGRQVVQLLVDGRPRAFVPLFADIQVTGRGQLPATAVLTNLRHRPDTEQRRLLNQGMLDLLDRALDKAADELPEEVFDDVLGHVMGYRQRLGL